MNHSSGKRMFRFGANYIPSRNWLYSWLDWDPASIREDLQAVASLGMDHIRAHLLWPYFQPNATWISSQALDRLEELLDICDSCGLDAEVTVLSGWMSGTAYYPAWKRDTNNMFTDSGVIEAQKLLFRALAERIGGHRRFLGFDLGNELSVLCYFTDTATLAEGDAWSAEMLAFCEEVAPGKFHVNGVDHIPWFADTGFSRQALSSTGAATSLHTWIQFAGALDLYQPLDPGCTGLAEYNIQLANAFSPDPGRPVWIEEFGAAVTWMPVEVIPDFSEQTIRRAASCENVWGFTWWCSHDIDRKFAGFHELEYDLGLFTIKNKPKPVASRIAGLIKEFKAAPPRVIPRPEAVVFPDSAPFVAENTPYTKGQIGWVFAKPYMELLRRGERPAIVLASKAGDAAHLRGRGITEVRGI